MNTESANLHAVLATDVLHAWCLTSDLDQLLSSITFLIQLSDISACHTFFQRYRDCVVNTLEPNSYMRNECNFSAKSVADFTLVDVVGQTVRNDVVGQVVNIILGAGFCACS